MIDMEEEEKEKYVIELDADTEDINHGELFELMQNYLDRYGIPGTYHKFMVRGDYYLVKNVFTCIKEKQINTVVQVKKHGYNSTF